MAEKINEDVEQEIAEGDLEVNNKRQRKVAFRSFGLVDDPLDWTEL